MLVWQTTSKGADGALASQSVLGELAWMPPTTGVLRYAQYLKQRGQNQATTPNNSVPPASQRKRVAALQHKVRVHPRIPMSPPKPSNKGVLEFCYDMTDWVLLPG